MINLSPEICRKLKEARRAAKLSQMELAEELGCNQSAISMFEKGDGTKLNDEVVKKLSEKFGIELTAPADESGASGNGSAPAILTTRVVTGTVPMLAHSGFCPNHDCISNHAYQVGGEIFLKPNREEADPVGGRFCAICGEVLIRRCPHCGAPVHDGAVCSYCGERYL